MEEKTKKDDWIRMASKSRPGRYYMFNKATGETQWLPLNQVTESEQHQQESPPKLSIIKKASRTPAQDRLKRLQHNLKSSQTNTNSTRKTRQSSDSETKSKEQENQSNEPSTSSLRLASERSPKKATKSVVKKMENSTPSMEESKKICRLDSSNSNEEPSTSSSRLAAEKSPRKATKRSLSGSLVKEMEYSLKKNKSSTMEESKKIRLLDSTNSTTLNLNKSTKKETATEPTVESKSLSSINNNNLDHTSDMEQDNSSSLNNLRSGIVKKIKEICKIPFTISRKKIEEKSCAKEDNSSSIINTNHFKPARKSSTQRLNLSAAREAINQLREESTNNLLTSNTSTEFTTPKNINIPTYPRGSANSRLERLKQSFQREQQQTSTSTNEISNSSCETNNNNTSFLQLENKHNTGHNDSTNSQYETANNTVNDDVEAMDWQPIVKDEDLIEISSSDTSLVIEKSKKLVFKASDSNENATMGDIYDTVNENLLRFSAEKHKDSTNPQTKWQKDFYYFVVDTNVLLKDLTFVEDLTKMKLCDTKGSMLYIPYSVLQELDKLKMRSGCQEGVKTLAVRAIKYLNSKFEINSPNLQAQSAIDERKHLVDVNSADDSIMNCCLQAKKHVPNLLLLTEDVNLRNKAICNKILVSTKSDLVSKRYDAANKDYKA